MSIDQIPAAQPLAGLKLAVFEDNSLIALDSQDTLLEAGAAEVHVLASAQAARDFILSAVAIDAAIVDIHLGDESGMGIAALLRDKKIAFLFSSGYSGDYVIPPEFTQIKLLHKPYFPADLIAAVRELRRGTPGEIPNADTP
jgi:DNA-binding response OmpR family regulator